jgi:hypothetical protein
MPSDHTIAFLRMAAVQIRRLIERDGPSWPSHDIAELRHVAAQCDREADELEGSNNRISDNS